MEGMPPAVPGEQGPKEQALLLPPSMPPTMFRKKPEGILDSSKSTTVLGGVKSAASWLI